MILFDLMIYKSEINNLLKVQNFKMAFSIAMPEAFRATLFNGSRDNDESKEPREFMGRVSTAQLLDY